MAGTLVGGKKASVSNKKRYGADYYQRIGKMGGKASKTGGFAAAVYCGYSDCGFFGEDKVHLIRQCAGAKGGKKSRRGKAKVQE